MYVFIISKHLQRRIDASFKQKKGGSDAPSKDNVVIDLVFCALFGRMEKGFKIF